MKRKPTSQGDYGPADLARAFSACLQVAEGLGEELMSHLTVLGGLAPYLLVPSDSLPRDTRHVGTLDLDLGMAVASSQEPGLYDRISRRLTAAGFSPEKDRQGRGQLEWRWPAAGVALVTLDLIADAEIGGVAPWLPEIRLALVDRRAIDINGRTLDGRDTSARVWVCNAASFLLLKAIAFRRRRERKDAHDLYFVLRYHDHASLLQAVARLIRDPNAHALIDVIRESFANHDAGGARAVAEFLCGHPDDEIQADVVGAALRILTPLFLV